jgi:thymidylate synthase (FAD)
VRPKGLDVVPEAVEAWDRAVSETKKSYREILAALQSRPPKTSHPEMIRAIRSAARSVLPNATETVIVVTANARALRNFLKTRGGIIGDFEMRLVAGELLEVLRPEAPSVFADFSVERLPDGLPIVIHRAQE